MIIEDGQGNGYKAGVSSTKRLLTDSVTQTLQTYSVLQGDAYNINTGNITYSASGTCIYLLNNEDQDLYIEAIAFGAGSGTTSNIGEITVIRDPTGGDLISDATAVDMNQNRNFGSSRSLSATVYKGKSGGSVSGGNDIVLFYHGTSSRLYATLDMIVPKGKSIAVKYDPKLSSGSIKAYTALVCHLA